MTSAVANVLATLNRNVIALRSPAAATDNPLDATITAAELRAYATQLTGHLELNYAVGWRIGNDVPLSDVENDPAWKAWQEKFTNDDKRLKVAIVEHQVKTAYIKEGKRMVTSYVLLTIEVK